MATLSFEELKAVRDCTDLWHQVYPDATVDDAVVAYKYFANPWALSDPLRVLYDASGPVTSIGYSALPIIRGDARYIAGQGGDAMSLPRRGGLNFAFLCKDEARFLLQQGADMHLGSPNANSLPFVLRFGGQVVAKLESMQKTPVQGLNIIDPNEGYIDVSVEGSIAFSLKDYDVLRTACSTYHVERSQEYYQWRFAGQSDKHFEYAYARDRQGVLLCYIFYVLRPWGVCEIVDWGALCDYPTASQCIQKLCRTIGELHQKPLFVSCLNRATGETELFSSAGFSTVNDDSGNPAVLNFTVKILKAELPKDLLDEASWKLTLSDFDHFMN